MPFDMYGDVILTRDVTERGLRAGDIGTVVERHWRAQRPRGRLLSRAVDGDPSRPSQLVQLVQPRDDLVPTRER
jgi:hypothetical protein